MSISELIVKNNTGVRQIVGTLIFEPGESRNLSEDLGQPAGLGEVLIYPLDMILADALDGGFFEQIGVLARTPSAPSALVRPATMYDIEASSDLGVYRGPVSSESLVQDPQRGDYVSLPSGEIKRYSGIVWETLTATSSLVGTQRTYFINATFATAELKIENPAVEVWVLQSAIPWVDVSTEVVDAQGYYTGTYNVVGLAEVDEDGNWNNQTAEFNAFRMDDLSGKYIVFDRRINKWIFMTCSFNHNQHGFPASANVDYAVGAEGDTLPVPYGRILVLDIDLSFLPSSVWRRAICDIAFTDFPEKRVSVSFPRGRITGYLQQR